MILKILEVGTHSQVTPSGTVVATINAMDHQDDVLTYAITNTSPFEIDNRGHIMINGVLEPISYRLDIEVSDDEHSVAVQLRVHVK